MRKDKGYRGYGVRSIIEALAPKLNQHESASEAIKNIARPIKGAGFATTVGGDPECRRARDTFWDIQVAKMTALGDSL